MNKYEPHRQEVERLLLENDLQHVAVAKILWTRLGENKNGNIIRFVKQIKESLHILTEMQTVRQSFDKNGEVVSSVQRRNQKNILPIPSNHEIIRLSTNASTGQQWTITQPIKEQISVEDAIKNLPNKPYFINRAEGNGVGVYFLSDFHMGAYVGKLIKTPDFNFGIIEAYLKEFSDYVNKQGHSEVYIGMLGDFIESFTGLNHKDSWKGLHKSADGVKGVILAHEVLRKTIYTKINNLYWVGFVSGNHDRVTEKIEGDQMGGAAELLHYFFKLEMKDVQSEWNPILITKTIDGINYIMTHGHLGLANSEIAQIVFLYGNQSMYNVFVKGHKHSRETKKTYKKRIDFEKFDVVTYDTVNYRAVTVPPLFTGNFYSESNGWTSTAGFVRFENNGRGKPNFFDMTL